MSRTKDRTYLRNRKRILDQDICWLCGQWIDHDLKSPHPMSWSADHVTPVGRGGSNHGELRPAHRSCNTRRGKNNPPPRHARQW